ncbi:2-keto-4-pentenoate hydratase [Kibdelosporangium aridum]|uniref:2-keto-4-pentenoate hydratase n=1 Tax=Kibdelosporangium aridum TaxID=2030 RepID=UPI0006904435
MNRHASRLLDAARTKIPIEPLGGLSVADAYAIQLAQIEARVAGGAWVTGHKIGLTSAAMQRQLGVDQPDFGHLLDDMEITANSVRAEDFVSPKAEPEIAFVLGTPLSGPDVSIEEKD